MVETRKEHGFGRRVIECRCGRTFEDPEKFDVHIRDEMVNEMTTDMRRTLRNALRPKEAHRG